MSWRDVIINLTHVKPKDISHDVPNRQTTSFMWEKKNLHSLYGMTIRSNRIDETIRINGQTIIMFGEQKRNSGNKLPNKFGLSVCNLKD